MLRLEEECKKPCVCVTPCQRVYDEQSPVKRFEAWHLGQGISGWGRACPVARSDGEKARVEGGAGFESESHRSPQGHTWTLELANLLALASLLEHQRRMGINKDKREVMRAGFLHAWVCIVARLRRASGY